MNRIDYLAEVSIGRGCAFAMLAIITTMCGMLGDLSLCLKTGAGLSALMGLVLEWRAWRAPRQDPRGTELYLLLDKGRDLPDGYPLPQLNGALQQTYLKYAQYTGALTLALATLAVVVPLLV